MNEYLTFIPISMRILVSRNPLLDDFYFWQAGNFLLLKKSNLHAQEVAAQYAAELFFDKPKPNCMFSIITCFIILYHHYSIIFK